MSIHLTVLIVNKFGESIDDYQQQLQQKGEDTYTVLVAQADAEVLVLSQTQSIDCILWVLASDQSQDWETFKQLQSTISKRCPSIIVVGSDQTSVAVQAFKHGAADYLIKDQVIADRLHLAIDNAIQNQNDALDQAPQFDSMQFQRSIENMLDCLGLFSSIRDDSGKIVDFRIDYLNVAACANNQVPKESQLGRRLCEVLPAHCEIGLFDEYCQVVETGQPLTKVSLIYEETPSNQRFLRAFDIRATKLNDGFVVTWRDVTDLQHTEQALRQSEERYRTLFESMNEGFCIIEVLFNEQERPVDYRFLEINPAFEQQSGLKQAVGKTMRQLQPDLEDGWFEIYGDVVLTGEPVHFEQASDVMNRWFEVSAFRLGAVSDRKVAILFKDISARKQVEQGISERRQTERELQESEARFRTLADNISQFAWMTDETGWIFWYNKRWFDYTGTTLDEMAGWGWQKVHHPDHVDRVVQKFSRCLKTGEPWEDTFPLRGKDGQYRWFLSRAIPVRDDQGKILCWFGTNTDITELKQAEEALLQSEDRYRCLAELIPQLVWTASPDGLLQDVNQRWEEFTGLPLEQALVSGWEQVVHPDDVPALVQRWAQAVQNRTLYQAEGRMRRADGKYFWFLHQAIPQQNDQGQIIKWFGTATDIEAQKQLERERDDLLQREQTAREAAERANRIKDEFLTVLSHELRSPLNPILGWSKLLQTRQLDAAKTAQALAIIERNAKVQAQLIDDLLDLAKILRGKLSLTVTAVNLATVTAAALDTVGAAAAAKSIAIQAELPDVGQISGDSARIQQIVWNLLSNAIKFTPNEGQVMIRLRQVDRQVEMTVQDTGRGISPDFLPHIFESFRQEDASITRKYGGLGLGLAIVRQLVEAHGGTINAESPGEGQGATFTVRLPLLNPGSDALPLPESSLQTLDLSGIRVLAVDDDPDARELIEVLLAQYGAEVMTVASATDAMAHLAAFQPHVLVSDIGMPDVDGYSLMEQIRQLPPEQGGQVPAIALTAYAKENDQKRALASGFQRHVTKPLELEQLVRTVSELTQAP